MATKYQMQGVFSGALISWRSVAPDWIGAAAPTFGLPVADIALSGGGFLNPGSAPDLYQVTIGGVGVTIGGVSVTITAAAPNPVTIGGVPVTIGGVAVLIS